MNVYGSDIFNHIATPHREQLLIETIDAEVALPHTFVLVRKTRVERRQVPFERRT